MKKVLLVLAFVAVYGVSMAMSLSTPVVALDETATIVVVDADEKVDKDTKKEAKAEAKGETKAKAKGEACSEGKAKACSGEAKAAKKDCSSSCSGKK